ncbi:MAG: DUF998 domain-containing protein [Dehalococcoidia bacterium]
MRTKALLACGVLSSALYLAAIDVVVPGLLPEYHDYTSQMVSELMALESPSRPVLVPLFTIYNLLLFPFAAGVWMSAAGRRSRLPAAVALGGYAACSSTGLFLAPMELRSAGLSSQTVLHIWVTALQGVFMALTLVSGAFVLGVRFRVYTFGTLAAALLFGALAGAAATETSMPWIGLTERVSIYAWMLWLAALAIALAMARSDSGSPSASHGPAPISPRS